MEREPHRAERAVSAPQLSRPMVLRDRLIARVAGRFSHPITVVNAGAGFGKTTLLVQAIDENLLAPRGVDFFVACRPEHRVQATLIDAIAQSLGERAAVSGSAGVGIAQVVDALRALAPLHVALIFDDAHVVEQASAGASVFEELADALPPHAHLVFAGRHDPPLRLARRRAGGLVHDIDEADLAFTDEELAAFATLRVTTAAAVGPAAGWPALAELAVSAGRDAAVEFLWDEVLAQLPEPRRRGLAMIHALGGADDRLLSAALGEETDVRSLTRSVPLTTVTDEGWAVVHDLWAPALQSTLTTAERRSALLAAAQAAEANHSYEIAVDLFTKSEAYGDLRSVAQRVCSDSHPLVAPDVLGDWHARLVAGGQGDTAEAALLAGAARKPGDPLGSMPYFALAEQRFAQSGAVDGEVAAIFHQGHIGWWHEDYDAIARLLARCVELAAAGSMLAASIATLGPMVISEVLGDGAGVIAAVRAAPREHQHPEVVPITEYLEARAHLALGDASAGLAAATRAVAGATPTMQPPASFEQLACLWALGRADDVVGRVGRALVELEGVGWLHNRAANGAQAALWSCVAGRREQAEQMLRSAMVVRDSTGSWAKSLLALAEVMLAVDSGEESAGRALLEVELTERPLVDPAVARAHRAWVPLSYVLVPSCRAEWDAQDLGGCVALARDAARVVCAVRERQAIDGAGVHLADAAVLRAFLPVPWLAELAVGLSVCGRVEAAQALLRDVTHKRLRERLHGLSKDKRKPVAVAATNLLAAGDFPPAARLSVGILGELRVAFDGEVLATVAFNRRAVRDLLFLLVDQRSVPRARLCALLWPDLEDAAARNNLRVALSTLLAAIEPDRVTGEKSYYVEDVGDVIRLRPGASIDIDVVEFDAALATAADLARQGAVSAAQRELARACALYRGDYMAEAFDAEWAERPREHYRRQFVRSAIRAGELALAAGDFDAAADFARRALIVDSWSEPAHRLLAESRLSQDDRSGALHALAECAEVLRELGVKPETATQMLARRAGFSPLS